MKTKDVLRRRGLQLRRKPTSFDRPAKAAPLLSSEQQTLEMIAQGARLCDVLDRLCRTVDALVPGVVSTLLLTAPDGQHLELGAGPRFPAVLKSATFPRVIGPAGCSCGTAAFLKQRVIVSDITTDSKWPDHCRRQAASHGLRASWSEPLISQDGSVLGVLTLYYTASIPEKSNLELIETAAHLALIAIQLDRSRKTLEEQETRFRNQQKLAEDELRAYEQAVEGLEEMIVVVDRDYRYLLANRTFLKMRNQTREQVLGRLARDVLNQGVFDETIKPRLDECFRGTIVRYEMKYTYPDIGERDVAVSYFPIEGVNGIDRAACIFSDITERKRAEARQRETEERFRLLADSAPVMIWMVGSDGQPIYFNQSWRDFTGRPLEDELQFGWATITHPDDLERCLRIANKGFASKRPFSKECRLRRHDGEYRWILDIGVPRFLPDGAFAGFIGSCVDVTDQKLAQETLSHINRRLITAQEDERAWIARELHDDIHQRVGLLAMQLERMRQIPPPSMAEWERETASASAQVVELGKDIQALSYRLHSPKLQYLGLATAASAFCREFSDREQADVDLHSENVPKDLPADNSLCLYRVLQEALQNALKHSGSREFQVLLAARSNEVELTVRDFGIGFRPEDAIKGPGLGLISMNERVVSLGGLLSVDSTLRQGTTIRARVPIGVRPRS